MHILVRNLDRTHNWNFATKSNADANFPAPQVIAEAVEEAEEELREELEAEQAEAEALAEEARGGLGGDGGDGGDGGADGGNGAGNSYVRPTKVVVPVSGAKFWGPHYVRFEQLLDDLSDIDLARRID